MPTQTTTAPANDILDSTPLFWGAADPYCARMPVASDNRKAAGPVCDPGYETTTLNVHSKSRWGVCANPIGGQVRVVCTSGNARTA